MQRDRESEIATSQGTYTLFEHPERHGGSEVCIYVKHIGDKGAGHSCNAKRRGSTISASRGARLRTPADIRDEASWSEVEHLGAFTIFHK